MRTKGLEMFVFKAAVIGAGTMGGEIAQVIANADIPVVLKDVEQKFVDQGLERAREVTKGQLDGLVAKEKLTQEQADARLDEVLGRIEGTTDYSGIGDVDFVIEAAPERIEIKQQVFDELDERTPGHAILASNTSSLSITEMGAMTLRPDKVVGFHFFYPASVMPLVEVIAGELTSEETLTAATNFARAIRKQPITCAEVPGFVVNRILNSAVGEVWRAQEEGGLSIKAIDEGVTAQNVAPLGPFVLADMLGLDTILHVAQHLKEAYGDRFYEHQGMRKLVEDGKLGAKSGGDGFYKDGEPQIQADGEPDAERLAELFSLKALVECCLIIEEGVASAKDIDLGMMAGAGLDPRRGLLPPLMKADVTGLDLVLEKLEQAEAEHGERFAPPRILRRLVAQGRFGQKVGQGFFAYPQPDDGEQPETVQLETRGNVAIAWLMHPPMNSLSPGVIGDLLTGWERVKAAEGVQAMLICSSIPFVFCAGADIKSFTELDEKSGDEFVTKSQAMLNEFGDGEVATIAAVNGLAFGGGCEVSMACDFRLAAESAAFGQPEINLGIVPGFGGTQRLPRLVGPEKALEMNLVGDEISASEAFQHGLVNRVVPDHELFDAALGWAQKLAGQAPVALAAIKRISDAPHLDKGLQDEKEAFAEVFQTDDAREGIGAFLGKRKPRWTGK